MKNSRAHVRHHILRDYKFSDWKDRFSGKGHYRDLVTDEHWRKGWISFDTVTWNPSDQKLYCGLNSTGEVPARIHELAVDEEERLYLGENDNHSRSSYLWTVEQ